MKNIKIFLKLCEMNLKKLLVFRASFWISLALMSIWVAAYLTLIEVIFFHTEKFAGWDKGSVLLIMSFYYFVQNLSDIFFKDNFEHFGERVRRGELDFHLVRPVSSRMLSFFWEIRFDHAASLIPTGFLFWYSLKNLGFSVSPLLFGAGLLLALVSLILYFSILSFIGTLTFWISRNDTFNVLIFNVSQLARYPRHMYQNFIGKILTFLIPIALIASVPAEAALAFSNGWLIPFFLVITAVMYLFSRWFWNFGIKRYTSSS